MRPGQLLASAIALAAGGLLVAFVRYTTLGKAVRSSSSTRRAPVCGINPARIRTLIFGLSGVLAALFAVTRSMTSPLTSPRHRLHDPRPHRRRRRWAGQRVRCAARRILLSIVNTVNAFYIGSYITTIVLLLSAAITIVIRPSGLLGLPR